VTSERTELEWAYEPADLFEAPYQCEAQEYDLLFDGGRAVATLRSAQNPVDAVFEEQVTTQIQNVLLARQLQVRRTYELQGPRIYQHTGGKKHVTIRVGSAALTMTAGQADVCVTDSAGHVIRDTRAERIAQDAAALDLLSSKAVQSPTLRGVLESYSRSISDPDDEFVHLYEVRDTLSAHYGSEGNTLAALKISKAEWQTLGLLANVEAIEEGRHRGKHPTGRRPATQAELDEARRIVRRWITAFAQGI
jgi:hypothetical protein